MFGNAASPGTQFYDDQYELWTDLREWANKRTRGRMGSIRIAPIQRGQGTRWFVNLAYSQCLFRVIDLERLTQFFSDVGLRPNHAADEYQLGLILRAHQENRRWFSSHAVRVLHCTRRRGDAIRQIAEHLRFWDGSPSARHSHSQSAARNTELTVAIHRKRSAVEFRLLNIDSEQTTDVFDQRQVNSLFHSDSLHRISIGQSVYRPRNVRYLLAVEHGALQHFVTVNRVRPEERFRLIVPFSDRYKWLRNAENVCKSGSLRVFFPAVFDAGESVARSSLFGLPSRWLLIEGECDVPGVDLGEPWNRVIDVQSPRIQAVGGLKLNRREWLTDAGPAVLVSGEHVPLCLLIDDHEVSIPTSKLVSHPILHAPGVHVVRLPGDAGRSRWLKVTVRDSVLSETFSGVPGWKHNAPEWPIVDHDMSENSAAIVVGMCVGERWTNARRLTHDDVVSPADSMERLMIRWLLQRKTMQVCPPRFKSLHDFPWHKTLEKTSSKESATSNLRIN
jgi:hypothetical protein